MPAIRPDRLLLTVTGLICLLHPLPGEAQTTTLIPVERAVRQQSVVQVRPRLDLPARSLLAGHTGLYRQGPLNAPVLSDTLRVLVLRLEFQPDSDAQTTGDGSFDLRDLATFRAEENHDIDATPHDRVFVERHMRALHNYWWAMSEGALNITSDIYPGGLADAYRLPREMAHYGFETSLGGIIEAFEALAADAVSAADAGAESIDWSGYDAFILFHAGADWQGDTVGAGDTPADLPTAWVQLGEPVRAGSRDIFDVTILPETVSQDGIIGAINGVFVHEFGHQLGLPDLYDTAGFETAVGLFALMDSGGDTGGTVDDIFVWGLLPAALSAWERLWFGWSDPVEIGPGESTDLVASTALTDIHDPPPGPDAVLIRAGEKQSFLVEFRSDDLDGDPSVSLFWEGGVIDGTGALINGEKVRTYEYDALLPSSGVLVWHLDDGVAEADPDGNGLTNFEENTLQTDRLRRFLDVEEADGLQELGWVPGYLGTADDFWRPGPDGPERFGPRTSPSSDSWSGATTGLELRIDDHTSPLARRLTVTSRSDLTGWSAPLTDPGPDISVPWMIDPDGDGQPIVAVLDGAGGLHLFDPDGTPAVGSNPVWTAPAPPTTGLTLAHDRIVVAADSLIVFLNAFGTETASFDLGSTIACQPVGYPGPDGATVLVATAAGDVHEVSESGINETWPVSPGITKLVYGSDLHRIAVSGSNAQLIQLLPDADGETRILWNGGPSRQIIDLVQYGSLHQSVPALAVLTDDGVLQRLRQTGSSTMEVAWSLELPEPAGGIAIADLMATRESALMVSTVDGISAVWAEGFLVAGWPPAPGGRASEESPAVTGIPLTLTNGVTVGLTEADDIMFLSPAAQLLAGPPRQLISRPVSAVTLGGGGSEPLYLLYSDSDSLRVASADVYGLDGAGPIWAGPGGSASGRGIPLQFKEEVSPDETDAPDALYLYPNPARDLCTIRAEGFQGELVVHGYTAGGTHLGVVARLWGGRVQSAGVVEQVWDVSRLAPGVYHLVVEQLDRSQFSADRIVLARHRLTLMVVR